MIQVSFDVIQAKLCLIGSTAQCFQIYLGNLQTRVETSLMKNTGKVCQLQEKFHKLRENSVDTANNIGLRSVFEVY